MKKTLQVFLVLLFCSCSSFFRGTKEIPLRDFFRNSDKTHFSISPNGKYISYLKSYEARLNIHIRDREGFENEVRVTSVTDRDISRYLWKSEDKIIFVKDFGGDENFHLFSVDVKTKSFKDITDYKDTRAIIIDDLETVDKNHMIVGLNDRDKKYFDVYKININTGDRKLILKNTQGYTTFLTDNKGELRGAIKSDGVNRTFYFKNQGRFKKIITTNFKETFYPVAFNKQNNRLYVLSNLRRDKISLVLYNPYRRREVKKIYQNKDVDVDSITISEKTKELLAVNYITWKTQNYFTDRNYKDLHDFLSKSLPGQEIKISDSDTEENHYIIITHSDKNPGKYYHLDKKKRKLTYLAARAPWLKESDLADMKPISYKSRDDLTIHGYLTLPKGEEPKSLPIIVIPHGGPWARDSWRYSSTVQFLANRGYGILQMNFRGSTGYGRKFWEASFKKWGKEMQHDITDGVEWLISRGIADRERICIYGGSYGGYAVLAGLAFTPDLYACGVDYVGVSNIFTLLETIPPYWEPYRKMLYEKVGHPVKDKELLKAASPLFHVDKIKAPLMVAQGANDPRVKKSESDQIVNALKSRGVDVPYILKENEGHGFRNEENKFELYQKMEVFFDKYLNP